MYKVNISNRGGYRFIARSNNYEFIIDPDGVGITPPDTLLASIASCIGVYIRKYADGARLDISDFEVSAEASFTADKPVRFGRIDVTIDLKGARIDQKREAALIAFIKNCPVHNTINGTPEFNIALASS